MKKASNRVLPLMMLLLAGCLGTGVALAIQSKKDARRAYGTTAPIPSVDSPEVQAAIEQTHRMVEALRDNGWRFGRVPQRLQNLPAQLQAEYPGDRERTRSAFAIPSPPGRYPYEEIATYSDVYVRKNIVHVGDRATAHPTGFYIVGWRDGRVETVPVEKVRMVPAGHDGKLALLFPGVADRSLDKNAP